MINSIEEKELVKTDTTIETNIIGVTRGPTKSNYPL